MRATTVGGRCETFAVENGVVGGGNPFSMSWNGR